MQNTEYNLIIFTNILRERRTYCIHGTKLEGHKQKHQAKKISITENRRAEIKRLVKWKKNLRNCSRKQKKKK